MPQTNSEAVGYECVEMQLKRFAAACYHKPVAEWAQQCHRPTARHLARSASDYKERFAAACYHKPVAEWAQQCHRPTARHLARSASDYKERFAAAGITSQWPSWCSNATDP